VTLLLLWHHDRIMLPQTHKRPTANILRAREHALSHHVISVDKSKNLQILIWHYRRKIWSFSCIWSCRVTTV